MAKYTDADLERARAFVAGLSSVPGLKAIAQLIDEVRNETIERCAVEVLATASLEAYGRSGQILLRAAADRLRALKDGAE